MQPTTDHYGTLPFVLTGAMLTQRGREDFVLTTEHGAELTFATSQVAGVKTSAEGLRTLCLSARTTEIRCDAHLWVLPAQGTRNAVCISGSGNKGAKNTPEGVVVTLEAGVYTLRLYVARPACNILGQRIALDFDGGDVLAQTYAHFYWDTLLPSVIENTDAHSYPLGTGYVVSTLQPGEYAGTYPDVDHEFQCKGRLALTGQCELDLVARMMGLQFRLMAEDPTGLWRNPCALQPNGDREYHVRRDSFDRKENAEMFLITGNVEILETAWLYFAATKDEAWLRNHIDDLEGAASLLEHLTDRNGKLWSDVYYEDQVIKDGRECMSAGMAVNGLRLLAELEGVLGQKAQVQRFTALADRVAQTMVKPLPDGFWDPEHKRFVDWVDRSGQVHDHIHLLANSLPVLFGAASPEQAQAVRALIDEHFGELQRFPTFLSPCIADYSDSEIGSGGPYDLCAAGRYWCWDAAYWAHLGRGDVLAAQLHRVAEQAALDGYRMGERYDMNHVYYADEKNWHGAPYYYEYPCVFTWVLVHDYLGIACGLDVDLVIAPRLVTYGSVQVDAHRVRYEYAADHFTLWNEAERTRTFRVDLSALCPGQGVQEVTVGAGACWRA